MLLEAIARTSATLAETPSRLRKIEALADTLRLGAPNEIPIAVSYLSGDIPGGTVGVGWASLRELPAPARKASLELLETHALLDRIRRTTGQGSQAARRALLRELFERASDLEQRFLRDLLLGELRQGALEGVMVEAVARAASVAAPAVRRAAMLSGDLGAVAAAAIAKGERGLAKFRLTVLHPVQPMLAQTADSLAQALPRTGPAAVEWKLDGARIQVHRAGDTVKAFTRNLADMTDRVPEVVAAVLELPADALILDGEAMALRPGARPAPFQVTMSRFGSRLDVDRHRRTVPISPFFFDLLHLDGEDLIDLSLSERFHRLESTIPQRMRVHREEAKDAEAAQLVLDAALERGHEGVMVKALAAPYEAGRRGASWLKVKPAHTLDLVVLAVEWGHGRRRGLLSNLHLGARDPESRGFVMLGKTFKGLTDEMLRWQTERFLELEISRDDYTVYVRPELVVEVAFDGVQASTRYPGGLALRFARVKGYRPDKNPQDADSIDAVRTIHAS